MAVDESGGLPWGDVRPEVAGFSDPNDAGERFVLPVYSGSEASIKATALVVFFGLIAYVHRRLVFGLLRSCRFHQLLFFQLDVAMKKCTLLCCSPLRSACSVVSGRNGCACFRA